MLHPKHYRTHLAYLALALFVVATAAGCRRGPQPSSSLPPEASGASANAAQTGGEGKVNNATASASSNAQPTVPSQPTPALGAAGPLTVAPLSFASVAQQADRSVVAIFTSTEDSRDDWSSGERSVP